MSEEVVISTDPTRAIIESTEHRVDIEEIDSLIITIRIRIVWRGSNKNACVLACTVDEKVW